jgi:hypothetical protein
MATQFNDLGRLLLLLVVLNMRVMCQRVKAITRHSCPPFTRHKKRAGFLGFVHSRAKCPWLPQL